MRQKIKNVFKNLCAFDADVQKTIGKNILLIGADEVGRGSLIGPVVAAAACVIRKLSQAEQAQLCELNDSKKLSWDQRERLYALLKDHPAIAVCVGEASKSEVDRFNIHQASLLASCRAYQAVCAQLDCAEAQTHLLLDGRALIPDLPPERQQAVIKGDSKSLVIAAASVVAKQYRDHMMIDLAKKYPGYGWEKNMGYPTPLHQQAIKEHGVTPLHRVNYKTVADQLSLGV